MRLWLGLEGGAGDLHCTLHQDQLGVRLLPRAPLVPEAPRDQVSYHPLCQ